MNKNAIQKYAIWARNELIEQIKQRAYQYGITEKGYGDEKATVISGRVLTPEEKKQRSDFIDQLKKRGFQQAVEEVAYTWFNRFIALRYMEVNDYLPTHVRVFSDANGSFNPEILRDVLHIDLPGLDKDKVSELLNANKAEELYRYLLLIQCNALNEALPEMFEKLGNYTEMLLPNNILKPDGVIGRLVTDIPEEDWHDAVQIIGWMYQYYNTEPKQAVFDGLKKNIKITKEKIPAATQLFTPDWIVRYMVENSLGRLWLESHPNESLKANWKYYIDEAEQTPEVAEQLRILRSQSPVKSPEDIRLLDPCMGSGHILVYAFDVLIQIYESEGYNPRDAVKLILEKNLYGLDIDCRACQLAFFALMMKARQYNRRIFTEDVKPQVYHPAGWDDGEEFGSLIKIDVLPPKPERFFADGDTYNPQYDDEFRIWNFIKLLSQKYDVIVTNPPYIGGKSQSSKLTEFLKYNYPDAKSDTFSAYIMRCEHMTKTGYIGMFTPYVWMFIQSYEKLRRLVYTMNDIVTLIQFEYSAFEEATVPVCTFVLRNNRTGMTGEYLRLVNFRGGMEVQRIKTLEAINNPECGYRYTASTSDFERIPGFPVAYWVGDTFTRTFQGIPIEKYAIATNGMFTCDNKRFLRLWTEVNYQDIYFGCESRADCENSHLKWYPYNKGGDFRRWYGNQEYVIYFKNFGEEISLYRVQSGQSASFPGEKFYFYESISWSLVSSSKFGVRYYPKGFVFDVAGSSLFPINQDNSYYLLGLLASNVIFYTLSVINPTINYQAGNIKSLPVILSEEHRPVIDVLVKENIIISKNDWDSFETSWDFKHHPMVNRKHTVEDSYKNWKYNTEERFDTLKANEVELNRIFLNIYCMQDELTPEVEDKDVTVYRIFDSKEDIPESMAGSRYALTKQDTIKTFISYAVGCMFGRYSLDVEGLAYAGGEWDAEKYKTYIPDKDNIMPVGDDEYFDNDIVGRFVEFVRVVYGEDTLEENLKFIADALGGKGTPREVIRNYFMNDFYKDHCKTYQKRPIYWMFDSGKKNGFKALFYLHRYSCDLLAKLRTDYVHEQQERYRTQLSNITAALNTATGAERVRLLKQQDKLTEQLKEITAFEEKVHHLADQRIEIDLDGGVKKNYETFADVLAKI